MNTLGKTLFGATAATALAVGSAAPAQARNGDGIDTGDVVAGALIIGGIAAIAALSSNDRDRHDRRYEPRRAGPYPGDRRGGWNGNYGRALSPQAAVNQCSDAAVRDASRYGRARITQITDVDRERDGYEVKGRLAVNEGPRWRNGRRDVDHGRFTCRIRYGQVDYLRVRGID